MGGSQSLSRVCGGPFMEPAKLSSAAATTPTFQQPTLEGNSPGEVASTVTTDLTDASLASTMGARTASNSSPAPAVSSSSSPSPSPSPSPQPVNDTTKGATTTTMKSATTTTAATTTTTTAAAAAVVVAAAETEPAETSGGGPMNPGSDAVFLGPQFGVAIEKCHATLLEAYDRGIPTVLVKMYDAFRRADGLSTPAVFKLAPKKAETIEVAQYDFEHKGACTIDDPHAIAQLMKRWFMELPDHVLSSVEPSDILVACDHEGATGGVADGLPEPQKSVFLWLLDCLLDVASCADVNKMTMGNLAIVWAPNLVAPKLPKGLSAPDDPTVGILYGKKCARFILTSIQWRGGAELIAKLTTTRTKPKVERRKSFKKKKSKKSKRKKRRDDGYDDDDDGEGDYDDSD